MVGIGARVRVNPFARLVGRLGFEQRRTGK